MMIGSAEGHTNPNAYANGGHRSHCAVKTEMGLLGGSAENDIH